MGDRIRKNNFTLAEEQQYIQNAFKVQTFTVRNSKQIQLDLTKYAAPATFIPVPIYNHEKTTKYSDNTDTQDCQYPVKIEEARIEEQTTFSSMTSLLNYMIPTYKSYLNGVDSTSLTSNFKMAYLASDEL